MTVEGTHPDLGEVMTRTLMHNVLVVDAAAGEPITRSTSGRRTIGGGSGPTGAVITVAVLPADANRLIVAQRTGTLHATLVSAKEVEAIVTDDAVSRRALLGLKEIVPPKRFTVEKWTGTTVQVLEMSDDRVQESRDVSGSRPVSTPAAEAAPATEPVAQPNQSVHNLPSGVKEPAATVVAAEPLALAEQAEAK
jgi:pilus assembly protein CpaB